MAAILILRDIQDAAVEKEAIKAGLVQKLEWGSPIWVKPDGATATATEPK